jgi:peptide/nickel transport system substrate-binding protein|tara:strand:- start:524 stop:2029 length:1506 start_codon:yes stop_codon:yes gene_type:complete
MLKSSILKSFILTFFVFLSLEAKEIKVIGAWEISGIEPAQSGFIFSRMQVAETLVSIDGNGDLIPNLAKSWDVSKDGLLWKFDIRENVKFQDGTKLSAKTVEYNLNRENLLKNSILRYLPIESIQAVNNTLQIKLSSQFSALPAYFAHYSTIILSKNSFEKNGKIKEIIGTGAYKIKSLTAPLKIKLTRFDKWWKGKANIKDITYLSVGKGETRSLMIKSHEADIAYSLLPISLKSLKNNPTLNTTIVTIPRSKLLKVNLGSFLLKDINVRRAISLALDRENMAKIILKNENLAANQLFPPSMKLWNNSNIKPIKQNITEANKLLEKAGWKLKSDGYRYKDNKKFEISLNTYPNRPDLPVLATAIQSQLKEVGIDVKVLIDSYTEIIRKHRDGTLDLALMSRNLALIPNPLGTLLQDYGRNGSDWGAMNWTNENMFKYLTQLRKKDNKDLHNKITQILYDDLPVIPVSWSELSVVSNKRIKNLKVDPFEINYFLSDITLEK